MAYTYIEVCNETLRRLNEVEMTSSQFSGAKGVQALVKDDINNSQREEKHLTPISYTEYVDRYIERDEQRDSGDYDTPEFVYLTPDFKLGVSPTPDKAYVVKYTYFKVPTELSASDDVPEVPVQYKNILIDGAMYHMYMMRDNIEQSDRSARAFEEGIDQMRSILINRYIRMRDTRVSDVIND